MQGNIDREMVTNDGLEMDGSFFTAPMPFHEFNLQFKIGNSIAFYQEPRDDGEVAKVAKAADRIHYGKWSIFITFE